MFLLLFLNLFLEAFRSNIILNQIISDVFFDLQPLLLLNLSIHRILSIRVPSLLLRKLLEVGLLDIVIILDTLLYQRRRSHVGRHSHLLNGCPES